ncbi:hypothetical protein Tsubulata_012444 [Turnera subulata]|uniref:Major facilitator superfamily (MFS) profile domain-containing protein n=1 Tax=Turnera subulata TaxID=218843 RepID=A0A9Q0JT03_9ROSI|nr:hypothetical protein Tsubulata_012444 [Turnera subulata]
MRGAVLVALAAAVGNMLQGWDNSVIAGSILYIKKEFKLESQPTLEGLIVSMSLIGGTIITTFSGPVSDMFGRRPMLIMSSMFYFFSGVIMFWAPNVYVLLVARLLDGFGIGLAVTLVPLYISETAPSEIRGQLNTFPQFLGSGGMFCSYIMVFGMSLMKSPSWRLMLGILAIPSLCFLALTILYLPESPRWLASKGKMDEAKVVLQRLRGREDVAGELALLVEGLGVSTEASIEEYVVASSNELSGQTNENGQVKLYGAEQGMSLVAKPVGQSVMSRHGSMASQNVPFVDPLVTLFGSVHENLPGLGGSMASMILPNSASLMNVVANHGKNEHWDEEAPKDCDSSPEGSRAGSSENLRSPLLQHRDHDADKDIAHPSSGSMIRGSSSLITPGEEAVMGIGAGWQLAYKMSEKVGKDGRKEKGLQRMFLHQDVGSRRGSMLGSMRGSVFSASGIDMPAAEGQVQATAVVSNTAVCSKDVLNPNSDGEPIIRPSETAAKGPSWSDLLEPGVKRALTVGIALQFLQQISGINGVLYYTPQILEQAGVVVLLSSLGLSSYSASFLISTFTTFLMLPCITVAMRLMDVAGRRAILLFTIPVLVVSLLALILGRAFNISEVLRAMISAASVMIYTSCFVMGFGVIPNILCSEIFPTRVRGLCITICSLTYWCFNIMITYSLPVMLSSLGLSGVFSIYAIGCMVSWVFVYMKVPETKGMPLEVICEFFAVGASALAKEE